MFRVVSPQVIHRKGATEPPTWFGGECVASGNNKGALFAAGQGDTAVLQERMSFARLRGELLHRTAQVRRGRLYGHRSVHTEL